jgi:hypothetical protein
VTAAVAQTAPVAPEAERWKPRTVQRLGEWACGAVRLKAYGVLEDGGTPLPPGLVAAARALVAAQDGAVAATAHRGFGFVILHRELAGTWLHLDWWIEGGTCAMLLWHAASDGLAFEALPRPAMACVWELALIDHERRAWIRTGMGPTADTGAYLTDIFRQDFC